MPPEECDERQSQSASSKLCFCEVVDITDSFPKKHPAIDREEFEVCRLVDERHDT
ncbi:MAG: hypothetical protein HOE90_02350 [Bacteriovoracaceae bacterium]|jgi:hypothetical protein|nr:hypothetical protein [Bacteriovoracaceae bacterium]